MNERSHIEVRPLAAGCLSGLGAGCLVGFGLLVLMPVVGYNGAHLTLGTAPGWVKILSLLGGMGMGILSGYVAARLARQAKRMHALIVGSVWLAVGLLQYAFPGPETGGVTELAEVLLFLPMALWGGSLAIAQQRRADSPANALRANPDPNLDLEGVWPPPPKDPDKHS